MSTRSGVWIASFLLIAAAWGCRRPRATEIAPEEGPPGASAVVRVTRLAPDTKSEALEVTVDGQPATVLRVEPTVGVEFLIPDRAPGPVEVALRVSGRNAGQVRFTVLAPPARQLVLTMTGERIALVSSRGASGLDRPSRELPSRRGLAYDVVARDGRLVATGTLPHPLLGRREVFEPEGVLHGVRPPASATFTLRIPAFQGGGVVRFFEFEPGTELSTPQGRAARRLVSEVEIGG
jgi:hypothetical protein